jgi:hypothetical protein
LLDGRGYRRLGDPKVHRRTRNLPGFCCRQEITYVPQGNGQSVPQSSPPISPALNRVSPNRTRYQNIRYALARFSIFHVLSDAQD